MANIGNVVKGHQYTVDYPAFLEWVKDYPMTLGHPLAYWDDNEIIIRDVFHWQYGDTVSIYVESNPRYYDKYQLFLASGLFCINGYKLAMGGGMPIKFILDRQEREG